MKDKRKKVAAILWLLAIVALNSYVLWKNGKNLVNADDSSELVLASLLSGGNGFISRGWVYSSELRVLNTQWIRALLFRFTDSWTAVRVVGNLALDGMASGRLSVFRGAADGEEELVLVYRALSAASLQP